ncbi:PREDICTED: aminopeptidase N-like isoform X1 [Nicrophorus vespilloides]|uniref:Aminopeptidase n=2 Tax=Nicrophorus vespilloides TaxID=110193 RepID=A0ABM1N9D9_NICVS|nr:PREDICTED: aminopeptidase N-like isoform X1 [Nicrophorus vespilloides]
MIKLHRTMNMRGLSCVLVALFGLSTAYRLSGDVVPEHYKLDIVTNLGDENDKFEFQGKVAIQATCVSATRNVTLHSKNLHLAENEIQVKDLNGGGTEAIEGFEYDKENEFFMVLLKEPLADGKKYEILIPFQGKLEDVLAGYYRSSFVDTNTKEKRYLATTQFEATDARRAFPCFDEPAMKSTFKISMGHTKKYSALSNMPVEQIEPMKEKQDWVWTHFENTVPMSTYLVAFIISDFGYESSRSSNNVTFKVWSRKDALNQVRFAGDVGPKTLDYFETYFDVDYPLPKQDMIAIPDFAAGAMENWGLITFRESRLLYDPEISSSSSQHQVASVIAHEMAHQWFGNLVTMKWWTDLWLNEGFATYMAGLAVHHIFPEWNSLEEESASNLLNVFGFDSLKTSHPVSVPVGHPREIDQIFDTIAYQKGSFLIRMMTLFLGEETFRMGVSNYLKKHKYGNAEQDDLWSSLTTEAHRSGFPKNLTVKTVMDTWTVQTGYPVIHVNRLYGQNALELKQERYYRDTIKPKSAGQCWWVPLSYTTATELQFNDTKPKIWLPCHNNVEIFEGFPKQDEWVIFNIRAAGLYRINYDEKNWQLLLDTLNSDKFESIPVLNRVQLIDDSSSLAWTGDLSYRIFFDLVKYLNREERYLPWKASLSNIGALNKRIKRTSTYGFFKVYLKELLEPIYEKVGALTLTKATKEKLDAVKHQTLIASWACRFGVSNCASEASRMFAEYMKNPTNTEIIPKDLRSVIFCNAIRRGAETEWEFLWQQYLKSNVATEKNSIMSALGCTREIWLLKRLLDFTLKDNSGIRKQDYSSVFTTVAGNDVGFYIAQRFLEENIKDIYKRLAPNTRRLSRYLSSLAGQMTSELEYDWFKNFTGKNEEYFKEAKQGVGQSLELIKVNIQWRNRHEKHLKCMLKKKEH